MNNFLDLLDTDQHIDLTVKLRAICDNGAPGVSLRVNNDVIEYLQLTTAVEHQFKLPLQDTVEIEVIMLNKIYSEHKETAVIIESVRIDNFEIVPQWTHLAQYQSERGPQGPTSYIGINGSWKLSVDRPFYQWRHQVTGQGWLLEPVSYEES
jgi:hypothetical protein